MQWKIYIKPISNEINAKQNIRYDGNRFIATAHKSHVNATRWKKNNENQYFHIRLHAAATANDTEPKKKHVKFQIHILFRMAERNNTLRFLNTYGGFKSDEHVVSKVSSRTECVRSKTVIIQGIITQSYCATAAIHCAINLLHTQKKKNSFQSALRVYFLTLLLEYWWKSSPMQLHF